MLVILCSNYLRGCYIRRCICIWARMSQQYIFQRAAKIWKLAGGAANHQIWGSAFRQSRWFTRGWSLQELLAPTTVIFLNQDWEEIGTKSSLSDAIFVITGIAHSNMTSFREANVALKMSWASQRETTRTEDIAFCLMGLFGMNMPSLYGEGRNAFLRLRLAILQMSDDETIFAWSGENHIPTGLLAPSRPSFVAVETSGRSRLTR